MILIMILVVVLDVLESVSNVTLHLLQMTGSLSSKSRSRLEFLSFIPGAYLLLSPPTDCKFSSLDVTV